MKINTIPTGHVEISNSGLYVYYGKCAAKRHGINLEDSYIVEAYNGIYACNLCSFPLDTNKNLDFLHFSPDLARKRIYGEC